MEPKVLKLEHPIGKGETAITELAFQGPVKGKHMKGVPIGVNMYVEHLLMVGGRLCNQPPSVMGELEGEDLMEVMAIVSDFLPNGQKTGQQPSE